MNAQEAKLGQFVEIRVTGEVVEITKDLVKVRVGHPNQNWKDWVVPVPWTAVEPMTEKELRDDPTIINGA